MPPPMKQSIIMGYNGLIKKSITKKQPPPGIMHICHTCVNTWQAVAGIAEKECLVDGQYFKM